MSKIQQAFDMIETLLRGEYEPFRFSIEKEDFLCDNSSVMEKENAEVNDILQNKIPDLCSEGEPGFDPTHMIQGIRAEYEKAKAVLNGQN